MDLEKPKPSESKAKKTKKDPKDIDETELVFLFTIFHNSRAKRIS